MASQYFAGEFKQRLPEYCIVDTTPPVFAGITNATPSEDGSIEVEFAAATSPKNPVDYHVYIALGSVSPLVLFQDSNIAVHLPAGVLSGRVFLLADQQTYLVNGQVYTLGVRANDAYGYKDSNVVIEVVTAIASGNLPFVLQTVTQDLQNLAASLVGNAVPGSIKAVVSDSADISGIVE